MEKQVKLVSDNKKYAKKNTKKFKKDMTIGEALKMCEGYGFETTNLDNYCGYAQIGEGEQLIGILGHVDIVPAGEGWDGDPFKMVEKDGKINIF